MDRYAVVVNMYTDLQSWTQLNDVRVLMSFEDRKLNLKRA